MLLIHICVRYEKALFELMYQILCCATGAVGLGTFSSAVHPALYVAIAMRVVSVTHLA
jgi:hypothetical protein